MSISLMGVSDLVACFSLASLGALLAWIPTARIMPSYLRKRQEIALIFGLCALLRGSEFFAWGTASASLHITTAVVDLLAASVTVLHLVRER